jgi:3-dehydroquinate synthase
MQQETLTVGLGQRAYDIVIGPDLVDRAGSILGPIAAGRHIIIVSDKTVATLHRDRLTAGLKTAARTINHFAVAAGEASKSMSVLAKLLDDILAIASTGRYC